MVMLLPLVSPQCTTKLYVPVGTKGSLNWFAREIPGLSVLMVAVKKLPKE